MFTDILYSSYLNNIMNVNSSSSFDLYNSSPEIVIIRENELINRGLVVNPSGK